MDAVAFAASGTVAGAVYTAPSVGLVTLTDGTDAPAQLRTALSTLSLPLEETTPVNEGSTSTLDSNILLTCAVFSAQADSSNMAAPETCGVAIDVPLIVA